MRFLKTVAGEYNKISGLPKDFTEVEYLQSSGTQYIDTGISPSGNTSFVLCSTQDGFDYNSGTTRFGSKVSEGDSQLAIITAASNTFRIDYGTGSTSQTNWTPTTKKIKKFDFDATTHTITITYIDDTTTTHTWLSSIAEFTSTVPLLIFAYKNGSTVYYATSMKVSLCKIYDNGTLVRDYIPALDPSGKPCMYDLVSKQPYYNLGTGADFTYGKKITAIEYLQSSGTQYIDTGLKGKNGYDFDYKFNSTRIDSTAYGIGGEWENGKSCYLGLIRDTNYFGYHYQNTSSAVQVQLLTANTDYRVQAHLYSGEQYYILNGTKSAVGTITGTFTSTSNMRLFSIYSSTPLYSYIKMYYCKIWDNGVLVRDYIPVRDENNVGYMLDKVAHTLYANGGTGTFVLGNDLPYNKTYTVLFPKENNSGLPAGLTQVEYLHADGAQWINTGLLSTNKSVVDVSFGFDTMESGTTNNCAIFGGRNNTTTTTFTLFKLATGNPQYFRFDYNNQNTIGTASNLTWNTTSIYRFQYDGTDMTSSNVTTGESTSTTKGPATSFTTSPILLFAVGTNTQAGQFMKGRIYHYYYSDGTNTIDLIPVLDRNDKPAMYDRIGKQLYYNQGSGADFTTGPKIYQVEYLQSSGTQYIDTGYKPVPATTKFELSFMPDTVIGNYFVFGARNDTSAGSATTCASYLSNKTMRKDWSGSGVMFDTILDTTTKYLYTAYDNTVSLNTESDTGTTTRSTTRLNYNFALFTVNTTGVFDSRMFQGKIYYAKLWDDGVLVRDYIPVVNENGVGYLLDKISNTVYSNRGTGNFICGKKTTLYGRMLLDENSIYKPVKCLASNGNQYIDTELKPDDTWGYRVRNTYTAGGGEQCAIGCMDSGNRFVGVYTSGSANAISGAWGSFVAFLPNYTWTTGTILDVKCNYKNDRKIMIGNVEEKDITDVHISGTIDNTLYLFARHYGGTITKMAGRIYGVEITIGNEIKYKFIPVLRKYDSKPGMLDILHNKFYTNAGSGEFTYEL